MELAEIIIEKIKIGDYDPKLKERCERDAIIRIFANIHDLFKMSTHFHKVNVFLSVLLK